MNHPEFTQLRRAIDEAITFNDLSEAWTLAEEGERLALARECVGELMYFRAQFSIIQGDHAAALSLLHQAVLLNPSDGAAYNDIALCLIELGRIEGVVTVFDQGIKVEPDYATIHHNKGWFLNQISQPEAALNCFEQALLLEPFRAVTYENMANAYEALMRLPEAISAYQQAIACLNGKFASVRQQMEQEIKRLEYA